MSTCLDEEYQNCGQLVIISLVIMGETLI